jgi:hypothetical protein
VSITVPASTTVAYFGLWDAVSGGNYYGGAALPTPETYTGIGLYLLTPNLGGSG